MVEDSRSVRLERQLRMYGFLESFQETLSGCRDTAAIYGSAVHRIAGFFEGCSVCLALHDPVSGTVSIAHTGGPKTEWDVELFGCVVEEERTLQQAGTVGVLVVHDDAVSTHTRWGVLAAHHPDQTPFTPLERQTLRAAARHVAAELEKRRLYLLDDVLDGLVRKAKPIDVYTHALRELRRFVRYDHSASVMTMQRGMAQVTVRAEKVVSFRGQKETLADSPRRGRPLRLTQAQTRFLTRLAEPIQLRKDGERYHLVGRHDSEAAGVWRVLSIGTGEEGTILCSPLIFGGQMLGLLRIAATRPEAFDELDLRILDRFARLLAVTLYRSEQYHQSDRQLQAIKEIGRVITEPISVEEVCRQVLQLALRVLRVEVGAVGLVDEDGALRLEAHQGCTLADVPVLAPGEGIAGTVARTGQSRAVPDVTHEPGYVLFNGRVRSELVAPIIFNHEVVGFLDVESFEEGRFREEDEELITFLEALANQAAIAIKSAQLHDLARRRLGSAMTIDPSLSMAGLHDLLIEELRDKIAQLAAANDHLAAASEAKSEFLAQMSHDLRGPLNVIVGLSSLLADPAVTETMDDEKRRESLDLIRSNGERLSALIGNILDISALEAGKSTLDIAPFQAETAFEYLIALTRTLAMESRKDLDITLRVDEGVRIIHADENKFLRILQNLLFNAVKFTPSGGKIALVARSAAHDGYAGSRTGQDLQVSVSDTGIGIPAEDLERVFQPFQQVDTQEARHYHGTGLGLTVVRQLVEAHGGRVWVESTPGTGTDIHLVLPDALGQGEEILETAQVESELERVPLTARPTILVVEDIPAHMSVMRLAVTSRGYEMHGVGTGAEALAWLAERCPHLIVLDMQLPDMDGFALAAQIKSRVETHQIPIIAVTADALSVNEDRARASGCDAYLTKPIDIAALLSTIETVTV